ncbi:PQQ-binding-like beta-propeller repeat protein [Nannocystis sp. ILAH1]|uniref:PQQ-binding-like beta-propeller repeat protein n=1 Tax=Nannocystis sp. ILAH1 TaxID=2996789 RepID=UPI002270746D|nr:PQQ-binding-like beta-propeller repeat protein [Nannocystis sp. ILAH1]MCY0991659.1 PQQ-binding-like beta-propeller repeat protein [Nannocystis sp. ILAH1]
MQDARGGRRSRAGGAVLALFAVTGCLGGATEREPELYSYWMGGPPILGDLNGDGVEELVGWFMDDGVVALDGTNYEPLWRRPDLEIERSSDGRLGVVAGGAVVLAQPRGLAILDPATGTTRTTLALTDEVQRLCAEGSKVGVHQIDHVRFVLDAATGQRDDAAKPPACLDPAARPILCETPTHARCEGNLSTRKARLTDPVTGDSVGVEVKDPGTPEVTLVGYDGAGQQTWRLLYDPKGRRVEAIELVGGTFLIRQSTTTALDARTGAVVWTSACGGTSGYAMVGTATRVYYECDGPKTSHALRIVDRATGAVLKTLGRPRGG